MQRNGKELRLRVDGYTRCCLTAIVVLLTVLIVGLWAEGVRPAREACAAGGIPNAGQQRQTMIKALQGNSEKLERLIRLFESGSAKVQLAEGPAKGGQQRAPAPKAR